jgi:hypothetical protein
MLHIHDTLHTVSLSSAKAFTHFFINGALEAMHRREKHENCDSVLLLKYLHRKKEEGDFKLPVDKFRAVMLFAARCTFFKEAKMTTIIIAASELGKYMVRNLELFEFWVVKSFVRCLCKVNRELITEWEERMK